MSTTSPLFFFLIFLGQEAFLLHLIGQSTSPMHAGQPRKCMHSWGWQVRLTGACRHKLNHPSLGIWSMTPMLLVGVISLCLWGISPSDFASFAHHFASFPHQICFISPTNCFISPTSCFISPTDCFISPTKFSLPHHYFASLCQKLEHNFLIFFPFFHLWSLILNNLFSGNCWSMCPVIVIKWYNPQALVLVQTSLS